MQDRVGHSDIGLTMDTYGKFAGRMVLTPEQEARFEALVVKVLPASAPVEPAENSGVEATADADHTTARDSDPESAS